MQFRSTIPSFIKISHIITYAKDDGRKRNKLHIYIFDFILFKRVFNLIYNVQVLRQFETQNTILLEYFLFRFPFYTEEILFCCFSLNEFRQNSFNAVSYWRDLLRIKPIICLLYLNASITSAMFLFTSKFSSSSTLLLYNVNEDR